MVTVRIILILISFVLLFVLGWQNVQELTTVRVFYRTFFDVPVAFVMLYSFAFGALCVGIFTIISEIQLRARLARQRKEMDALTEELRALRDAPLHPGLPPAVSPPASPDEPAEVEHD
ncbi:MAG: LapA family protein [candidate division WOR-3 bacterium]